MKGRVLIGVGPSFERATAVIAKGGARRNGASKGSIHELAAGMARHGYAIERADDALELFDVAWNGTFDAVVVPLPKDAKPVVEKIRESRERSPTTLWVVLSDGETNSAALDAARVGALSLPSDVTSEELDHILRRFLPESTTEPETPAGSPRKPAASGARRRRPEPHVLHPGAESGRLFPGAAPRIVGLHPALQQPLRVIERVAPTHATVLITGESGTGKGLIASTLHAWSRRADRPFVTLNCAALAASVLESELFGHERGAFTGAVARREGRFEQAHTGTLYLDEVSEIPLETQVKLLRFLQDREFERVGGNQTLVVDVRLVAATNRDLAAEVEAGRFREDLFYRLKVICVELPPLRDRRSDIPALARRFMEEFAKEYDRPIQTIAPEALDALMRCAWPGNVRELEHAIEHAVVMSVGSIILPEHLPESVVRDARRRPGFEEEVRIPGSTLAAIERTAILRTLEAAGGNTLLAAEALGISQRKVQYRLREYGIRAQSQTKREAEEKARPLEERPSVRKSQ